MAHTRAGFWQTYKMKLINCDTGVCGCAALMFTAGTFAICYENNNFVM